MSDDSVVWLWAKTGQKENEFLYHPLLFHMLDVAAVTELLFDHHILDMIRSRLYAQLGDRTKEGIVFIAGIHDIGKASPCFQHKRDELAQFIPLRFSKFDQIKPHGFISACVMKDILGPVLSKITGGHHGVIPLANDIQMARDTLGNKQWDHARSILLNQFATIIKSSVLVQSIDHTGISDPLLVPLLSGLISVADWIGSNQDFFPCVAEPGTPLKTTRDQYYEEAKGKARRALHELGWMPQVMYAEEAPFGDVFSGFTPNSLQETVNGLAEKQHSPYLMIIEAPTGKGKTEAALYAADLALCRGFARGLYIAMPTQATGNSMYQRVLNNYLKERGHKGNLNLQLVHGDSQLALSKEVKEGEISEFKSDVMDDQNNKGESNVEVQLWFTARKRPLLSPFGVGTIDQSMMSVIQTKHWFVRLFGLAGKVIIFDEIHAYDAYMNTIIERLLSWLAEMDCTVILLSATLPQERRKALISAYSGKQPADTISYPRITVAQPKQFLTGNPTTVPICESFSEKESRSIKLNFLENDLRGIASELSERLKNGGCAAMLCDTVDRSIEVFEYLRENLYDTECFLFHARTLQMWRREKEKEILDKFGKGEKQPDGLYTNPDRPFRSVLVATQVIEQSLDLDFDLMYSEMAPVDLLLQRAGRLHRHFRIRPVGLETPEFTILSDAGLDGPPPQTFGDSIERIYDRYILLKTWATLREKEWLETPSETENMIEAVYGEQVVPEDVEWVKALSDAKRVMENIQQESQKAAFRILVDPPMHPEDLLRQFNNQLVDDDDPEIHETVRAATREGDPSITVIMVHESTQLNPVPDIPQIRELLDRSVKLSHRGLYHYLKSEGECPEEWRTVAHLRHARMLRYDDDGRVSIEGYTLTVTEETGMEIEKEVKE